jgi:hypothetical protein
VVGVTRARQSQVVIRCYETMGVPNSLAECLQCGTKKSYYPGQAKREGFRSDLDAAESWAAQHREDCDG